MPPLSEYSAIPSILYLSWDDPRMADISCSQCWSIQGFLVYCIQKPRRAIFTFPHCGAVLLQQNEHLQHGASLQSSPPQRSEHSKFGVQVRSARNVHILINYGVRMDYVSKRTYA